MKIYDFILCYNKRSFTYFLKGISFFAILLYHRTCIVDHEVIARISENWVLIYKTDKKRQHVVTFSGLSSLIHMLDVVTESFIWCILFKRRTLIIFSSMIVTFIDCTNYQKSISLSEWIYVSFKKIVSNFFCRSMFCKMILFCIYV